MLGRHREREEETMEEKMQRIISWLKEIDKSEHIPEFEVDARTIDILHKIVECSEDVDRDISLLIKDVEERTTECEAETTRLQNILTEILGLNPSDVSGKANSYLEVLVECAMALETKDTSISSLFCAMADTSVALCETELKNQELEAELNKMGKILPAVLMLEQQLKEDLKKAEEQLERDKAKTDRQSRNLKFLKDKMEDFKVRISAAEEKLAELGLEQSLMHVSLVLLSQKLADTNKEIEALEKDVSAFLDLPPNPSMVQVRIEEVKQQLNTVEAELTKEISRMVVDMVEPRRSLQ
ncbi:HAUS augmin-like complex subunit 1 [Cuculus canorus]|uniref:HAUS augmin-like complex subunit 1 n=1 Tax=Cuculus canorus TaxID=55661 RepID=UPI0023AACAB5|nr:HAUS augmin-like complex subunit 1 [Cuculus canorus]